MVTRGNKLGRMKKRQQKITVPHDVGSSFTLNIIILMQWKTINENYYGIVYKHQIHTEWRGDMTKHSEWRIYVKLMGFSQMIASVIGMMVIVPLVVALNTDNFPEDRSEPIWIGAAIVMFVLFAFLYSSVLLIVAAELEAENESDTAYKCCESWKITNIVINIVLFVLIVALFYTIETYLDLVSVDVNDKWRKMTRLYKLALGFVLSQMVCHCIIYRYAQDHKTASDATHAQLALKA